ncbi:MAG: hypothetical protein E6G41_11485 [Actinobacteria bacterium]|nr:MAG: hypothetical protein E6G41_11485 [Actinomycetota bacterium]
MLAVAGAFVVVATFAFSSSTSTSIDFAISIGATLTGLAIARTNLAVGLGTTLVGAWSILVTLGIFSGSTQRWLDFAAGVAFAAAGLVAGALIERSQRRAAPVVAPATSNGYRVYEQDRVAA